MNRRASDGRLSADGQTICRPSIPACSFVYQLPDVVLQRDRRRAMPYAETFNGIILFADVSGFTEMCQKYSSDVRRGVNQLANALNSYMAPIVEAILREKGDVYKFAGDAVLGLWPFETDSLEHKHEQAKRAISCALYMKKAFCDYVTSIGTVLNIKSAIATGSYSIIFLRGSSPTCAKLLEEFGMKSGGAKAENGNYSSQIYRKGSSRRIPSHYNTIRGNVSEEMLEHCRANVVNYYVCYGSAVVSVRNAEHQCKSQDIVVDMGTWSLLDSDAEYVHEKFSVEHDDEEAEIPARSSNHQAEIIGQGPSNTITNSMNKRLSPPNKNRDVPPVRKIIAHYIRVYGRRNDTMTEVDSLESRSVMSIDSIEPKENSDVWRKSRVNTHHSPIKNLISQWTSNPAAAHKSPAFDGSENEGKDYLSVSSNPHRPQTPPASPRIDLTEEESMNLRPSSCLNLDEYDTSDLNTFIIRSIRNQESFDQLSELRLINICFINLLLTDYRIKELPMKLQTVIDCCSEQISITNGLLTKVFMFDKGLSLLCAFGMPGYKHSDDAERALKFSFLITQRLEKLSFVARVSTGVTTGQTFCGVLGHPLRCEYTVIGRKVNMAARLMMNYPGVVSCDDETFHKAHLEERYFELLPSVPLKGLTVSTCMRRYKGQADDNDNLSVFVFPIIDREDEWNIIFEYVEQVFNHTCHSISCVFLTGATGVGRSRLLAHVNEELMYDTQNIRRVSYNASFEHSQLFGFTLKQLFKKLLFTELQESDALLTVLKSLLPNHQRHLYLLRPYFDKLNVDMDKVSNESKKILLEEIIRELIINSTNPHFEIFNYQPQPVIFIVDDAQYIDKESWEYLPLLGSAPTSLLIVAMRDPTLNDDELQTRLTNLREATTTKYIPLLGLDNRYLTTLACQAMFVQRIPKDLEVLLTRKSDKGLPQNVVQLLSDLLSNQVIRIETMNDDELDEISVEGIQKYLWKRVAQHDPATGNVKILFEYVEPQYCRICDPDRNTFWSYTTVIENTNAHMKIDKLRDLEKRIAKISSLFTKNIPKRVIVYAMTNFDIHTNELFGTHPQTSSSKPKHPSSGLTAELLKINSAFSQLYRAQIFECAWVEFEARKNPLVARLVLEKNMTPICCCPENPTKQIENCRMFTFKDPSLKEATLATIIDQFQHDFSSKMAAFVESKSQRCKSCGGDSDSLIFLTPIQSMKLGMSILDTFHERKLKQLNQRLQYILFNRFLMQQTRLTMSEEELRSAASPNTLPTDDEKSLLHDFYQEIHDKESQEKKKYFQALTTNSLNLNASSMKKQRFYKFRRKKSSIRCHLRLISSNSNSNSKKIRLQTIDELLSCNNTSASLSFSNHAISDRERRKSSRTKRLLTKEIMSEAEHLVKHLHLSKKSEATSNFLLKSLISPDHDSEEASPHRPVGPPKFSTIDERLELSFTETCPLFLLKDGVDHRFEFFDFAPDLSVRQEFRPMENDEAESHAELLNSGPTSQTNVFVANSSTSEVEFNQRNCRCNYLLVEVYRLLIKLWDQAANVEKVLFYSLALARVELARTNYYEAKIILQNLLERLDRSADFLHLPTFFEPQIYELLSESAYRMRKTDEAFLYVIYGLKILDVQLIDFRSQDSSKLKSQCKHLRHTLIRTLIGHSNEQKLSDEDLIRRYFSGKFLFRAGQCARRHGQLFYAYFCLLNGSLALIQCQSILTNYEHCQALALLAELSHDLKRMEDCDLFVQAILKFIEPIRTGYETLAIKSNWLAMTWNLYRGKVDRALNDSYKIKDLLNKIGAYENLMSVATYSLQAALIARREEVIQNLMEIVDNESNRPLQYENRLWAFILILEAFVELNLSYNESLLDQVVLAIEYIFEHLEKKTSSPGEIHKFLTIVFYAQATLVECYTKLVNFPRANQHYVRAIKFGMSLKEWTFRVYNGMLKLALYEIYECTKWLIESRQTVLPADVHSRLIVSHLTEISQHFKLLRPRYLMCYALKLLLQGQQRSSKCQFSNASRLAHQLDLEGEREQIEMTRKKIFRLIKTKRKSARE